MRAVRRAPVCDRETKKASRDASGAPPAGLDLASHSGSRDESHVGLSNVRQVTRFPRDVNPAAAVDGRWAFARLSAR